MNVVLDGRYRIIKRIGKGGFSHTYLAQNLARPELPACVIKHLKPQVQHPRVLQLFQAEARVLDRLDHQQIPSSTECFEQNGEVFLVQDFIDGHDLGKEYLRGRQWLESEMRGFLRDLLEVLKYVHQHHIIHRDVKPDNIIQRKDNGKFVLIDFGAVHEVDVPIPDASRVIVGTAGYRSPEQLRGEACFSIDIYSLGITAIQLLTLTHPQYLQTIDHQLVWREKTIIGSGLAGIIDKMICPQVAGRYQSATDVLADLDQLPAVTVRTLIQPEENTDQQRSFPLKFKLLLGALIGCSFIGTVGTAYLSNTATNDPVINQVHH